jgi:outer membrane murein-binding lipoprotein Lpp
MKIKNKYLLAAIFMATFLFTGCITTNKHYRDESGVLKTDTRSATGIHK